MEALEFIRVQFERAIMETLMILLDDLALRIEENEEQYPQDRLIYANANKMREHIRHLLSIPMEAVVGGVPVSIQAGVPISGVPPYTPKSSRIASGIANGTIKQNPSVEGGDTEVPFGMGKVIITENDKELEEDPPTYVKPFKPRTTDPAK